MTREALFALAAGQEGVMGTLGRKSEALKKGAQHLWEQAVLHAPKVLSALAILLLFWLLALLLRVVITRLLGMTKLDEAVATTRVGKILKALSEKLTASKAIAKIGYYALLLVGLTAAADTVGLTAVGKILSAVLGYVPNLLSAVLIVAVGGYFASLVARAVSSTLKEMRSPYARPLSAISEGGILLIVFTLAIDKLGVDLSLVTANLTLILAAVTLTLCFLFGWSMRRPAEELIANYYLRRMVSVGDRVVLGEIEGTVERFAAIGLMLRDDTGELQFVPARHVLDGLRRKAAAKEPAKE